MKPFSHFTTSRRRRSSWDAGRRSGRRARIEPLEPRRLLAATYLIEDLGTLADTDSSAAVDVNNSGVVVGYASRSGLFPVTRAFRFDSTVGIEDLGTLGGEDAGARAVNDAGQITGWSNDAEGKGQGFRLDPGSDMFALGGLGTNAGVYPQGINAAGDVVGTSFHFGMQVAFLYTDAGGIQLAGGTPSSSRTYLGYDVNDAGKIVGYSYLIGAFMSGPNGAGAGALGTGWAYAVNNSDQVTGSTGAFDPDSHLFRFSPAVGVEDLGALPGGDTVGLDINEAGQIVGRGKAADGVDHAVFWDEADGLVDLNHLVAPDAGWLLQTAAGVNDNGQIAGTGVIDGQTRGFLLTPFADADTEPPVASLVAETLRDGGGPGFRFDVVWWDRSGVDTATLDDADLRVVSPGGAAFPATLVAVDGGDAVRRVATYEVESPDGVWGAVHNGSYSVEVVNGQVRDVPGLAVAGGPLGALNVSIDAHVAVQVDGPAVVQAGQAAAFTLSAATTSTFDSNETFSYQLDWDGDGTTDQTVAGSGATPVEHTFAQDGTVTVLVTATDSAAVTSEPVTHEVLVTPVAGYQTWEFGPSLPGSSRTSMAAVSHNGTLYLLGGGPFVNGGEEGAVHILPPAGAAWQSAQHLDSGRLEDVGAGIDELGRRIVYGGTREGQPSVVTFVHSLQDGKGDELADKNLAFIEFASAADDDGRLYALGGLDDTGATQTGVERYDGSSDNWTVVAPLPAARSHAAAARDGQGRLLLIGGEDAGGARSASVFSYDVAADQWSQLNDAPAALSRAEAVLGTDGLVYLMGGELAAGTPSAGLFIFNPTSGQWSIGADMQHARSDFAAVLGDDGFIYAVGGQTETVERIDTNAAGLSPIAVDDHVVGNEDRTFPIDVLDNDDDPDGDPLVVSALDLAGTRGTATIQTDGTIAFVPAADDEGSDEFGYTISDPAGRSASARVTVDLTGDGMTAGDDTAATDEDTVLAVAAPGLLAGDGSSNAGASLTIVSVDAHSTLGAGVTAQSDGSFEYDPTGVAAIQSLSPGEALVDRFGYVASDGTGSTERGTVEVAVSGLNDAPRAAADAVVVGYKIETVDVPDATGVQIYAVNNLGHVAGTFTDADGGHGFLYDGHTVTLLEDPDGNSLSPRGLNDAGVVVGGAAGYGFVFDGVNLQQHRYAGRDTGFADLNNHGVVAGAYSYPWSSYMNVSYGLIYQNGGSTPSNHPDNVNGRGQWLADVNDNGTVAGNYYPGFYGRARGYLFDGEQYTDVLVPGTTWVTAEGLNNAGHVVGVQIRDNGADRFGFVYNGSEYESFRFPGTTGWTMLNDINDAGVLVGYAGAEGFIARPAGTTDKQTVFVGRAVSLLGNDADADADDPLSVRIETVTSTHGATVRLHADGRFDYDPAGSTTLEALADGESLTDTFTYTLLDAAGASDSAEVSIVVTGSVGDGSEPTAVATPGDVSEAGTEYAFDVTYADDTALDVSSLGDGDVRVAGPGGFDVAATLVGVNDPTDGPTRTATYRITPPGGTWDGADNGTYSLALQPGEVLDVDGNAAAALPLATFNVAMQADPTLDITGPAAAAADETVTLSLHAVSSYPSDPLDVFTFEVDWNGDGTVDETALGVTGMQVSHAYGVGGAKTVRVTARDVHGRVTAPVTHSLFVSSYQVWESAPGFAFARTGAAGVNHNGTLYALGGRPFSNNEALDAAAHYLPPGGEQWLAGPYLEGKIDGQGAGVDQHGRIVVVGGFEPGHGHAGGNYVYDLVEGPNDGVADRTGSPFGFAYATDDQNAIYTLGGVKLSFYPDASDPNVGTVERYDADTDTWQLLAPMPAVRAYAAGVYDGRGHILVIGGSASRSGSGGNTVLTYDIATDTWLDDPFNDRYYMPKAPVAMSGARATLGADGVVYVTHGSQTFLLDPRTRAWATGPPMPNEHTFHAAVLGDDGYVYAIGGSLSAYYNGGTGAVDKINTLGQAAPRLLAPPQAEAIVGEPFEAGAFVNANPRPTFELLSGPAGATVDPASGVLDWTPAADQVGSQDFTLRATNPLGQIEFAVSVDVLAEPRDVHAPSAPTNLHHVGSTQTSITVAWDAAADNRGVSHYKLYRYHKINRWRSTYVLVADNIPSTEHTVTGLTAGSGFKYSVSAVDAAGNESWRTASLVVATLPPESAPNVYHNPSGSNEIVYAMAGEGLFVGIDNGFFVPGAYVIGVTGNPAPSVSFVDGPAGMAYDGETGAIVWVPAPEDVGPVSVTVEAANGVGTAQHTFGFDVYPAGTDMIPPTPTWSIGATDVTPFGATIQWTPANDDVGVVGYKIKAQRDGHAQSLLTVADTNSPATTFTIDSFTPGTGYRIWAAGYDAAGHEASISGTTPAHVVTTLPPGSVDGVFLIYNNSALDGNDPAADAADDAALAGDKTPLLPGQTATSAHYSGFSRGINAVAVDLLGTVGPITGSDFEFHVGNHDDTTAWAAAPTPQSLTVRPGPGGADRVTVTWADGAIRNQWLQIVVKGGVTHAATTGLAADEIYLFGNAVGETGNAAGNALVNAADVVAIRDNPHGPSNRASIDDPHDLNRDRSVNAIDLILARNSATGPLSALRLITPSVTPAAAPAAAAEGESVFRGSSVPTGSAARAESLDGLMADASNQAAWDTLLPSPILSKLLHRNFMLQ